MQHEAMVPLNVGLVGYGMAGQIFHAPVIAASPYLRLTHIVQRHGDAAKERYPDATIVRDVGALLESGTVQLVVIATPNETHAPLAALALDAGKHVVVDKPFTTSSDDGRRLVARAQTAGRLLTVFHNRRWDGDFLTVRRVLDEGWLGTLVEYESRYDRYRPVVRPSAWREQARPGSGILFDLGSHLIDQAQVLFGWPEWVSARIVRQRRGALTDDCFDLALGYPGVVARLKAGMLVREPGPRFALHGTGGSFVKFGLDPQEEALRSGHVPADADAWGVDPEERWGLLNAEIRGVHVRERIETQPGRYQSFYDNVAAAIAGREPLNVTGEQALGTIRLIELALDSHREQRVIPT